MHESAGLFEIRDERRGLLVVFGQALGDDVGGVVGALHERSAVFVVDTGHLRRVELFVVDATGARVRPAAGDALDQHAVVDVEDHRDRLEALGREQRFEGFGLRERAREAVDDHVLDVREFGFDHPDHEVIGHEFARIHVALGFEAERRFLAAMTAQHVAGRDLTIPETVLENLSLRALTGTRRAQKHENHFLMNPR